MLRNSKGFTLVEVMIVLTILSILMVSLSNLLLNSNGFFQRVSNQSELQQNLRLALITIIRDIQKCKYIDNDSSSTEIVLVFPDGQRIRYGLKPDDMQEEHKFQLTGQVLFQQKNNGNREPLANFINSINFSYNNSLPEKSTFVTVEISGQVTPHKEITLKSGAGLKWASFALATN